MNQSKQQPKCIRLPRMDMVRAAAERTASRLCALQSVWHWRCLDCLLSLRGKGWGWSRNYRVKMMEKSWFFASQRVALYMFVLCEFAMPKVWRQQEEKLMQSTVKTYQCKNMTINPECKIVILQRNKNDNLSERIYWNNYGCSVKDFNIPKFYIYCVFFNFKFWRWGH